MRGIGSVYISALVDYRGHNTVAELNHCPADNLSDAQSQLSSNLIVSYRIVLQITTTSAEWLGRAPYA